MGPFRKNILFPTNNLDRLVVLFFLASVFFFYVDFSKEKLKSKNDLIYVSGPFLWYNYTLYTKTSVFSFRLKNYSSIFRINSDYLELLNISKFKALTSGKIITIGIHPSNQDNLNDDDSPIFVYSIESGSQVYLNVSDSIKKYNSSIVKFFWPLFLSLSILSDIFYFKRK